ncbi:DUF4199 domain-containing protein [Aquimarina sp. AU474]|uniref:DUF4199 domain-containing protein n=1 Tax=Aquimarina sp. AU474 TaxID=2108529 RepID=UPI000D6960E6|nr:DUF4199 domain-containing protein [Aquimarina sp. AU474]
MKEKTVSIKKHIITYGVVLGIIKIIYGLIGIYTDYHWNHYDDLGKMVSSLLELFFYSSFLSFGIYKYKILNNKLLSLKQALKIGLGTMLIGACMRRVWKIILYTIIDPDLFNRHIGFPEDVSINPEEYTFGKAFDYLVTESLPLLIFYLALAAIISLISGAIMYKRLI